MSQVMLKGGQGHWLLVEKLLDKMVWLLLAGCGHAGLDATGLNRGAAGGQTEIKY